MKSTKGFKSAGTLIAVAVLVLAVAATGLWAKQSKPAPAKAPAAKKADGDVIAMKNISINKKTKEIRISVKTALQKGILEYLLVGDKGKAYESAFKVADNLPSELYFALTLIGCEPLPYDAFMKLLESPKGKEEIQKGHAASLLSIELLKGGKPAPLASVVRDREKGAGELIFVFTGGRFIKQSAYSADQERSFIGLWPDLSAVVNLFSTHKNPYRGEYGYEMNTATKGLAADQAYELVIRRKS